MTENKKIIAVIGMAGSGKSEVANYLKNKFNWPSVYFGSITFELLKKEGMEVNYKNEQYMRERIRIKYGMGAYAELSLPQIEKELEKSDILIIESLYSWSEYKILKQRYGDAFFVISVYASPKTRFKRLMGRKEERPMQSHEEFQLRDYTEIENIEKGGPIAMADYTIINEGGLEELYKNIEQIVKKVTS